MRKIFFFAMLCLAACSGSGDESIDPGSNYPQIETSTVTDKDGNVYGTVKIGAQWWMSENLRNTTFCEVDDTGDNIQLAIVSDPETWQTTIAPAADYYEFDPANTQPNGLYYNWMAATSSLNICPCGWHVPTKNDWDELITYAGGESEAGGAFKNLTYWMPTLYQNNDPGYYGFNSFPAGWKFDDGTFSDLKWHTSWWEDGGTITQFGIEYGYERTSRLNHSDLYRDGLPIGYGLSIRCIKD